MRSLPKKLENPTISIFPVMSGLCRKHNAINLAQGFPSFPADPVLIDLISEYSKKGFNQYAPLMGDFELRKTLTNQYQEKHGTNYNPENECIVVSGATQGIFTAITTIMNSGDEIIIIEPAYDCYAPSIEMLGGKAVPIEMNQGTYEIPWENIEKAVTKKTVGIIINNPHNPTGKILSTDDLDSLEKLVVKHDLFVISDEVYEHIVFDGKKHLSIGSRPTLANRSFIIYSFGKTYHLTGWRAGFVLAPKALMESFVYYHQFQTYAVNTPLQKALSNYAKNALNHEYLSNFFQKKRDLFLKEIQGSLFKPLACEGSYFILLDYSAISDLDDRTFSELLIEQYKIGSIPISVFYSDNRQDKVIRFCFAKTDEEIIKGANILQQILPIK
jgi:methionine aminotransferase